MTGVIHCPHCHGGVSYHVSQRGSAVNCPHCGRPFSIPHLPPAAPVPAAVRPTTPRKRRVTTLRRDFVCLRSTCDAKRTVADYEVDGPVRCPECSGKMVSELKLLGNLDNPKVRAKFAALGYGMMYTDEARADAEQFVGLCVAHVHKGVEPGVAVSAELAPLGLDRTTGTPAMRAFTASCGFYEWLYEEALLRPDGDPSKDTELGVLEAVLDHPLYRNDELQARLAAIRGDPFAPRPESAGGGFPDLTAPDEHDTGCSLPRPPGAPENPFTALDNSRPPPARRGAAYTRSGGESGTALIRFVLAPLGLVLAVAGWVAAVEFAAPFQNGILLACGLLGLVSALTLLLGEEYINWLRG